MFPTEAVPERLGSYKIVRPLGAAGSVQVYLGRKDGPLGFHHDVELKLLPDTSEGSDRFAQELAREAAICARLNHPAVVRMFDFFEHQGKIVLAVEHVEATSLERLLRDLAERRERLGDAAIFYIGHQVAGALAHAHAAVDEHGLAAPIIHRNLSPENILITTDGQVRLTGFGLGKILGRTPDTAIGTIKGTPGYMAPEQRRGEPVTTKADVCGLSLLLWSLLAGCRPPIDGSWPPSVASLRKDLSPAIATTIDAGLDPFPGTRKITCAEIERRLAEVAGAPGKAYLKERITALLAEPIDASPDPPTLPPPPNRNPFEGVRFGPPGPAPPPREEASPISVVAPLPKGMPEMDWRRSLPSVDSLDRFFIDPALPEAAIPAPPAPAVRAAASPAIASPPPAPRPGPPPRPRVTAPLAGDAAKVAPPAIRFGAAPDEPRPPAASAAITPPPSMPVEPAAVNAAPAPSVPVEPAAINVAPPSSVPVEPAAINVAPPPSVPVESAAANAAPPAGRHRPPSPSLLRLPRALSASDAIAVSAVTATLVVIVAFLIWSRLQGPAPTPVAAAIPEATAAPPPPAAPPKAAPEPTATASAAAAPPETPDVAALSAGYGYLTVATPAVADVYLSGKLAGPANQALEVRCGRWFVRLATPGDERYPEWVSRGETVDVTCQGATRRAMSPSPSRAPSRSPRGNR